MVTFLWGKSVVFLLYTHFVSHENPLPCRTVIDFSVSVVNVGDFLVQDFLGIVQAIYYNYPAVIISFGLFGVVIFIVKEV